MIKKNVQNVVLNSVIALETIQRCFILVTLKRISVNKKQVNVNFKLTKGAEIEMLVFPPPPRIIGSFGTPSKFVFDKEHLRQIWCFLPVSVTIFPSNQSTATDACIYFLSKINAFR